MKIEIRFQSTGPLRDPTGKISRIKFNSDISIHRSLAGPDLFDELHHAVWIKISIHRSLAGPDPHRNSPPSRLRNFNPQVPCGTRPDSHGIRTATTGYFNPQVPCGTRPRKERNRGGRSHISIHRSLAGPDQIACGLPILAEEFQSTGPLRDPTRAASIRCSSGLRISIHRSLAGPDPGETVGDSTVPAFQSTGPLRDPTRKRAVRNDVRRHFNPQVPCGTRPKSKLTGVLDKAFQSTGPLRDPTQGSKSPD